MVEWAARAVVTDVRFFLAADREATLAERARLLGDHAWEEVGGTWAEKQARIERLAISLGEQVGLDGELLETVRQAAGLSKADRTTELV
ncbi:glycine--tRNA ligase subunit beta, partial [Enterococcus hirae]